MAPDRVHGRHDRSLSDAALIGLDDSEAVSSAPLTAAALCDALYPGRTTRRTPVAVFSDFFCPFCRRLIQMLHDRQDSGADDIEVFWHELPLLGRSSEMAALGAIAAGLQGRYATYQKMLAATQFRPTERFLVETADMLGLDTERFTRDLSRGEVETALDTSRRAAGALGVYGTPAMTIGKTIVMGEVSEAEFDRLIALETDRETGC